MRTISTESKALLNVPDFIIFQLVIFEYKLATCASQKLVPNLRIETGIWSILLGTLSFRAIIYHHSNNLCSGNYTSAVKYNETWFSVDTEHDVRFTCTINYYIVPYLMIYKKKSNAMVIRNEDIHLHTGELNNPVASELIQQL